MWVSSEARWQGVARQMLDFVEVRARLEGLALLRLDTNKALPEARSLYLKAGYRPIPRYSDNPYADFWFGKTL
jgi:GNAT superfamily N-acetyltransferase